MFSQLKKVLQRGNSDCGMACLAMVTGKPLSYVKLVFENLGLKGKHGTRRPWASNGRDVIRTAERLGTPLYRGHFSSWDALPGEVNIVKVNADARGRGHWIVAIPHSEHIARILDPATDLPAFIDNPPLDVLCIRTDFYQPSGLILYAGSNC